MSDIQIIVNCSDVIKRFFPNLIHGSHIVFCCNVAHLHTVKKRDIIEGFDCDNFIAPDLLN